jgi:predicted Zn finger-like uncharacterized protein
MLISCPNCATSYEVSAASLGSEGRSVKCVRCQEVWFATPAEASVAGHAGAAAASAQYRRGTVAPPSVPESPTDDAGEEAADDPWVDPNLAARAADRAHVEYDGPPLADDADADAVGDVDDAPPLAPEPGESAAAPAPREDIETVAARRIRRASGRRGSRSLSPWLLAVIVVLAILDAVLIGWRADIVRTMPQTASFYADIGLPVNLRGLAFADVTSAFETSEGVPVLLVKGRITNIARQPREVPRLRLALRSAAGAEVYAWTALPVKSKLAPGEEEPFETRLASPPTDGQAVVLRFFNRGDLAAGMH